MTMQDTTYIRNFLKKLRVHILAGHSNAPSHVDVHMRVCLPDATSCTSWAARSRYVGAIKASMRFDERAHVGRHLREGDVALLAEAPARATVF